jgi:very-short-patch-repair endonuclease
VHRGVLVAHNGPTNDDQRLWIASLAAGAGKPALLGGRSALGVLGMKGFPCDRIHVLLSGRREDNPPSHVIIHRTGRLVAADVHGKGLPPCTTAGRSVVDAATWARSDREARTVIAMAFQQRLVTLDEVRDALRRMPRARRRKLTWVTSADAAGGAESLGELDVTRLLRDAGLPKPTHQRLRTDASGRRRYLDLYFEQWGLHVEIDGSHHLDPQQAWLDADRQNQVWITGDRILRFPAWLVREQPDAVVNTISTALLAAGWRPA